MTGNNKLFYSYINGKKEYVHAATSTQAAVALKDRTGISFVDPNKVYEEIPLMKFKVFAKNRYGNACNYKYVAAKSAKQASFLAGKYYGCFFFPEGSCEEAEPGTKLGDLFEADWTSPDCDSFIANININK